MTIDSDDKVPIQSTRAKDGVAQLDMYFVFDPPVDALTETWDNAQDLRDFIRTSSRPVRMPLICSLYALCLRMCTRAYFRR